MNPQTVKLLILAVLTLGVGFLTVHLGPCPPEPDGPLQPLSSEAERQVLPEILVLRLAAKGQIARDVIAGRLPLVQSAALFGALNRLPPESAKPSLLSLRPSPVRFPAHTDEEWLCLQVVECVGCELAEELDRREAVVARLETEFKEHIRKAGVIQLPNPLTLVPVEKLLERARAELTDRGVLSPRGRGDLGTRKS
jgi:hypothetical protein